MRPPPPTLWSITDASVFNLNQPEGGLIQLHLAQALGTWESGMDVRKWYSRALAIHSFSSFGSDWVYCRATLFLLSQMDQIPKRKRRCHGIWWCLEASLEVQLVRSQSKIGKPKVWMRLEGGSRWFQKLIEWGQSWSKWLMDFEPELQTGHLWSRFNPLKPKTYLTGMLLYIHSHMKIRNFRGPLTIQI